MRRKVPAEYVWGSLFGAMPVGRFHMELTSEEKQRIREEELKRAAEEQYRAQVRSRLHSGNGPELPSFAGHHAEPESEERSHIGLVSVIIVVILLGGLALLKLYRPSSDHVGVERKDTAPAFAPRTRYVPVSQNIASGQITVPPRDDWHYPLRITGEMLGARLIGAFNASGGSGNDIEVAIMPESEFPNWANGHPAKVVYSSGGRETTGNFDVALSPGSYVLDFSNRFSLFNAKFVGIQVDLNYQRQETY